jgi:hypothetical protein
MTLQQSVHPAHHLPANGSVGAGILSMKVAESYTSRSIAAASQEAGAIGPGLLNRQSPNSGLHRLVVVALILVLVDIVFIDGNAAVRSAAK